MRALIEAAGPAGIWKLVSRIFIENTASRRLMASMGFREVGIYEKHARLDGQWRDVVIVERLIPENITSMRRSVPQIISLVAIVAGLVLFVVTMLGIDRTETLIEARSLGAALPLVLLPSIGWHLLRAAGWYVCFPPESRPDVLAGLPGPARGRRRRLLHDSRRGERAAARRAADGPRLARSSAPRRRCSSAPRWAS